MKRLILTCVIFFVSAITIASQEKHPVYCDVCEFGDHGFGKNATIAFDFGLDRFVSILDGSGKEMKFSGAIAAINYMTTKGWRLFAVYPSTSTTASVFMDAIKSKMEVYVTHYIMIKEVTNDSEIFDGITTSKIMTKERKKSQPTNDGYGY